MPLSDIGPFSVSYLQVLDAQGQLDAALDPKMTDAQLLETYRWMVLAREADQRMLKLQRQGRIGTFPLCTGQEAASVAPALAMRDGDWFVGAFRELGGRLVRGESLLDYMLYYNGLEEGNGTDVDKRVMPIAVIVASQLMHAVGLGQAMRYKKQDSAVVVFVGDGGTSEGDFHEALNFAALWNSPVVFIVQNNQWAISVPRSKQTKSKTIAQKAIAYDMPGIQVDGNDALAMYRATSEALERARKGEGPTLIEAVTYRLMQHTTADDPTKYRSDDEVEAWKDKDPLLRFRSHLQNLKLWDADKEQALRAECKQDIDATVQQLEAYVMQKPDAPFDHVWGEQNPDIEAQRQEFLTRIEAQKEAQHG